MRLSLTRGAWTASVPDPTVTRRSRARPLRTTSRLPPSSRSSANRSTYSSASAFSAAAIIRRAPSRASPSSVTPSSLSSPTGSLRTSSMACLPLPPHGGRSLSTGKVRRPALQAARPQHLGIARTLAVQAFPLSDVQAYMGHADIDTTMLYVHHTPQHDAADRLSRLVELQAPAMQTVIQASV